VVNCTNVTARAEPGLQLTKLGDWREQLLRIALTWSGILNLAGACIYTLVTESPQLALSALAVALGTLHFAARVIVGRQKLRSILFLISVYLEMTAFGVQYTWSPTVLLAALFGTVYGGLLLGRFGALAFPIGAMLLLLTGGFAVKSGWSVDVGFLDLSVARGWFRSGALVTCLTAMMAISLRRVLRLLTSAQQQASQTLHETEQEAVLLHAARSARMATERALLDSQKLQTVALLSGGLAHLLNNSLLVVRDAAEQLKLGCSRDDVHRIAREVTASVVHAAETTRSLLVFSRHDESATQAISIDELCSDLCGGRTRPHRGRLERRQRRTYDCTQLVSHCNCRPGCLRVCIALGT
jgi:signal transduction histidine kinase